MANGKKKVARQKKTEKTDTAIVKVKPDILTLAEAVEKVLIAGDLSPLTPEQRVDYYKKVCLSLGVNPLTKPFEYILFREGDNSPAKLVLYATKSCTEQLRAIHGVSVVPPLRRMRLDDIVTVEADVRDRTGRTDTASGSVALFKFKDGKRIELTGKELCNAEMKCETKAKRRATLSICGLAFLDESELDTMQIVGGVTKEGRIYHYPDNDVPDSGSHEKAQEVLRAKLAAHAEGKPINPITEAPAQPESQHSGIPEAVKTEPLPELPKDAPRVEIDWEDAAAPIVRGDLANLLPLLQEHCKMTWDEKVSWWRCQPRDVQTIGEMCAQLGFRLTEVHPKVSGVGVTSHVAPPTSPEPAAKGGSSQRTQRPAPAAESTLISGVIEQVFAPPNAKNPMRQVKILLPNGKKPTLGCFDQKFFADLDKAKGPIEVYITKNVKGENTYYNIVKLKKLGKKEWDADGTPAIQRKDQEAGQRTLY